jgi:Skp family chaperone for outer membrane proteins
MNRFTRCLVVVGTAGTLAGATTGTAAAAAPTGVVAAIKGQERVLKSAGKAEDLQHVKINTPAKARALEAKYKDLATKFDHAAAVVSHAQATTPSQKRGQTDWVTAVRGAAKGFDQFGTALGDIAAKHKSAAKSELLTAVKTVASNAKLLLKADKLLGLPSKGTGA